MEHEKIANQLTGLLPDRPANIGLTDAEREGLVSQEALRIKNKQSAKELASLKYKEKRKLKQLEEKQALAEEAGVELMPGQTLHQAKALAEQQKRVETIEAIEAETAEPLNITELTSRKGSYSSKIGQALQLQGASRAEMTKLLTGLNINLSVQLTKQDTANLLACLLTCNETQLNALYNNKKIPIVIKAVIKRLQEDTKLGNIDVVERLWDRIFGKGQMALNLPETQQLQTGILPNVPVSREAYVIIRDTLLT